MRTLQVIESLGGTPWRKRLANIMASRSILTT